MSRWIGEASVLFSSDGQRNTPKITCHVKTNESEKIYSDEKQFELHGL